PKASTNMTAGRSKISVNKAYSTKSIATANHKISLRCKPSAEAAAALFHILSRGHSRFVHDLRKILGKSQDCRSCTARGHPAKVALEFGEAGAATIVGGLQRPEGGFVAQQHDAHAEDVFLGYDVAADVPAACSAAILK